MLISTSDTEFLGWRDQSLVLPGSCGTLLALRKRSKQECLADLSLFCLPGMLYRCLQFHRSTVLLLQGTITGLVSVRVYLLSEFGGMSLFMCSSSAGTVYEAISLEGAVEARCSQCKQSRVPWTVWLCVPRRRNYPRKTASAGSGCFQLIKSNQALLHQFVHALPVSRLST